MQHLGTQELTSCVGRDLTSFMAFPERKQGGSNRWRGNCSPEVIRAVLKHVLQCREYEGKQNQDFVLLDPMSGSGTSGDVADSEGVQSLLYDLNPEPARGKGNWDALKDEVEESASMIFLHPPYHSIIQYSGSVWGNPHPDDLSHCSSYRDYIDKLNFIIKEAFYQSETWRVLSGTCGGHTNPWNLPFHCCGYDDDRNTGILDSQGAV